MSTNLTVPQDLPWAQDAGTELLSTLFAIAFWGVTCSQTVFYFIKYFPFVFSCTWVIRRFSHDDLILKALVTWLWLADTTHQYLLVQGLYYAQITNFCKYEQFFMVNTEYLWQVLLTTFVALPSQLFFIDRIGKFSGNRWLPLTLWVPTAVFQLAGGLVFIAYGTITPVAEVLVTRVPSAMFTAVQVTAAVVDISITVGLVYLLWRSRQDAQYKMRTVLYRLVVLSLSTGMWTALFAIFTVITILAFRNTFIYAALYFPLCPLYCNTVLANLNARTVVTRGYDASDNALTFLHEPISLDPTPTVSRSIAPERDNSEGDSQISSRSVKQRHLSERGMQTFADVERMSWPRR